MISADEQLLRDQIAEKEHELKLMRDDLQFLVEMRQARERKVKGPLGVDVSAFDAVQCGIK